MTNRKVKIPLTVKGIEQAIKAVEDYKIWLKERSQVLLDRLAQAGFEVASARFAKAAYDGTNDTSVSMETRSDGVRAVVAVGASVLFIEFGTGVTYPDNHPQAAELGMKRGEYGQGHGKQWFKFRDDPNAEKMLSDFMQSDTASAARLIDEFESRFQHDHRYEREGKDRNTL